MQKKAILFHILWAVAFLALMGTLLHFLVALFRPVHTDFGSTWDQFRAEPRNSIDVLFLGSSYAYCDWNPGVMYDASGLTGYVMAGGEQPPALTYRYLKEALKTQTPSVVILEGSGLFFDRYQNYTQINIGYMPWGLNRIMAILESAEPEKRVGLFFELYFYHDRWKTLTDQDWDKAFHPAGTDRLKGHTAVDQVFENTAGGPWLSDMRQTEEVYQQNIASLGRMARLCADRGIDFILAVNPTFSQYTPQVYARLEEDAARVSGGTIRFVNWADSFGEIGLDPTLHLLDGGHLNAEGAKILSSYTGNYLRELGYTPRPQSEAVRRDWEETAAYWRGE